MSDVPYLLSDSSFYRNNSLQPLEKGKKELFKVQKIIRAEIPESLYKQSKKIGGLTKEERLAKIKKYKNKKRIWKSKKVIKKNKGMLMTGQLEVITKPIFKYTRDLK